MSRNQLFTMQKIINKASIGLLSDITVQCHTDLEGPYVSGWIKDNCRKILDMVTCEMACRIA